MTSEFRTVLFHVRERLIQVREMLLQNEAAASEPMTIGQALCYLRQAINLELARLEVAAKPPIPDPARSERGKQALRAYFESEDEHLNNPRRQIAELVADLLHLAVEIDKRPDAVESTLRRARASFVRERSRAQGSHA